MLELITPMILTYNEAPNIGRTLEKLRWARDIVVVDSFSSDETLALVSECPQARVFQRKFDSFASQCNFGLRETGIASEWVLSLDADYILTDEIVEEMAALVPDAGTDGFSAAFTYCIGGRRLRSGVYPPVTVLFRRSAASYVDDGHSHRVKVNGSIRAFRSRILHDDRKSLSHWLGSQQRYQALEAQKLVSASADKLTFADRIRRLRVIAPAAVLFYCLIIRGGVFDGWPGFYYAFQRTVAELLLSLYLLENDFNAATEPRRQNAGGSRQEAEASQRSSVR